jgi:hypothetical protein
MHTSRISIIFTFVSMTRTSFFEALPPPGIASHVAHVPQPLTPKLDPEAAATEHTPTTLPLPTVKLEDMGSGDIMPAAEPEPEPAPAAPGPKLEAEEFDTDVSTRVEADEDAPRATVLMSIDEPISSIPRVTPPFVSKKKNENKSYMKSNKST